MDQAPDWAEYFTHVTDHQATQFRELDEMRSNDPILWAMLTGSRSAKGIALKLAYPLEVVKIELREYKAHGLAEDEQGADGVIWRIIITQELGLLKDFILEVRRTMQKETERNG